MRSRLLAVLSLAFLLTGCAGAGKSNPPLSTTPPSTPTVPVSSPASTPSVQESVSSPDRIGERDRARLVAILGARVGDAGCSIQTSSRQACGRQLAAVTQQAGRALALLRTMPKTAPYKKVTDSLDLVQTANGTMTSLGCFKPAVPKDLELCTSLSSIVSAYLIATEMALR